MHKNDNIIDFLCALDEVSKKHDLYLDIKYEDGVRLVNEKGKVIATEFHHDVDMGYECYDD
jgi:hypothetical protein